MIWSLPSVAIKSPARLKCTLLIGSSCPAAVAIDGSREPRPRQTFSSPPAAPTYIVPSASNATPAVGCVPSKGRASSSPDGNSSTAVLPSLLDVAKRSPLLSKAMFQTSLVCAPVSGSNSWAASATDQP